MSACSQIFNPKFASDYEPTDIEGVFNKERFQINFTDEEVETLECVFNNSHNHVLKRYVRTIYLMPR